MSSCYDLKLRKELFLFICHVFLAALSSYYQSYSIALGATYSSDIETAGFHTRAYYNFTNGMFRFGPEFIRFANKEES